MGTVTEPAADAVVTATGAAAAAAVIETAAAANVINGVAAAVESDARKAKGASTKTWESLGTPRTSRVH